MMRSVVLKGTLIGVGVAELPPQAMRLPSSAMGMRCRSMSSFSVWVGPALATPAKLPAYLTAPLLTVRGAPRISWQEFFIRNGVSMRSSLAALLLVPALLTPHVALAGTRARAQAPVPHQAAQAPRP